MYLGTSQVQGHLEALGSLPRTSATRTANLLLGEQEVDNITYANVSRYMARLDVTGQAGLYTLKTLTWCNIQLSRKLVPRRQQHLS
jgi:hypothetical protein